MSAQRHVLYRFYGDNGQLLYVGITVDPTARWKQHRKDKQWWREVRGISLDEYPDRASVMAAEKRAIQVEKPKYNKARPAEPGRYHDAPPVRLTHELTWDCASCYEPIADDHGLLWCDMLKALHSERASDYLGCIPWLPLHYWCFAEADEDIPPYGIEIGEVRTLASFIKWNAHLLEKSWLRYTNWRDLCFQIAKEAE